MNNFLIEPQVPLCNVAILAGGQGTRIASRSGNLPKPMISVVGKPVLQHQIELCRKHGFTNIALLVHHRHEVISDYFGDGSSFGVNIHYLLEKKPRGTSGALRDALHMMRSHFLLLYGDTYLDVDLSRFFDAHLKFDADATLFLHPNDHPYDSDLVDLDEDGWVRAVYPCPHPKGRDRRNLVNAALYAVRNVDLEKVTPETGKEDIAKNMFPAMLEAGLHLRGYVTPEYIKDMGTPDRLDKVERDIEAGLPEALSWRGERKAVFLDRDGTLNQEINHLKFPEQLELLPGVGEAVQRLNRAGVLAVLTTNQPVIARGDVTVDGLREIHAHLESLIGTHRAYLDAIYYCPHHPDKGFEGEVSELKVVCDCRKPATGMIEKAAREWAISRADSWLVGDTSSDMEAGRRAGVRTILVRTGYAGRDAKYAGRPDYTTTNLVEAVTWITDGHALARQRLAPAVIRGLDGYRIVLIDGLARSGKSFAAQVLKEIFAVFGKTAHVISLDGWLKPAFEHGYSVKGLERYDLVRANDELGGLAGAVQRTEFHESLYDRYTQKMSVHTERHSVGVDDVLIIEGLFALQLPLIMESSRILRIFVQSAEETRLRRLNEDFTMCGYSENRINKILEHCALDEKELVFQATDSADFVINWDK